MAWGAIAKGLGGAFMAQQANANQARLAATPGNPANAAQGMIPQQPQSQQAPANPQGGDPGVGQAQHITPVQMIAHSSPLASFFAQMMMKKQPQQAAPTQSWTAGDQGP